MRHRLILGGSINAPLGFTFNPFVIISSGQPFNITTGLDTNGDSLFTERPTYAQLFSRCAALGLTNSYCDASDAADVNAYLPRNYETGPSFATINLRLSKTFGFGGESSGNYGGFQGGGSGGGGLGGPPPGGGGSSANRYNLTFSLNALNLFNNTNAGTPIGNLSSSLFGSSNSLAGGFGFGPPGSSTGSAAYNRRLEAQVRFSF